MSLVVACCLTVARPPDARVALPEGREVLALEGLWFEPCADSLYCRLAEERLGIALCGRPTG